jgi:hypothetical protein
MQQEGAKVEAVAPTMAAAKSGDSSCSLRARLVAFYARHHPEKLSPAVLDEVSPYHGPKDFFPASFVSLCVS